MHSNPKNKEQGQNEAMCSRGQTPVDYLIGISLVLVTILGTFALVPMVFDPFEPAVSPDKQSMADRLADNLIANNTYPGEARTLNRTDLDNSLNDLNTTDAGIPDRERVNVTVQNGAGTQVATGGESFPPNVGGVAMAVRTFTTRNQTCGPSDSELNSCQLVVRVWG